VFVLPRGVSIGLLNLFLIAPLLAFGVAELYALSPELAAGLVLLGASPGGTMANLLTHLARGDLALSVTMTAVSSVASVLTVPIYLTLAANHFDAGDIADEISMGGVVVRVFLITIVPLATGMYLRHRNPAWADEVQNRVKRIALGLFICIIAAAVASEFGTITDNFTSVAVAALTLNVLAMSVSYGAAKVARLDDRQSTAISMELGVHNSTLAITVATAVSTELAIPAAVYSAFMFITAGLFARLMFRRNGGRTAPHAAPAPEAG
jgi:BASS family bile acid:Na+ symporter